MLRWMVWAGVAGCASSLLAAEAPELPPLKSTGALAIRGVTPLMQEVDASGFCELAVDLSATYDNPYDPEQIDLRAELRTADGKVRLVPGFYLQPLRRTDAAGDDGPPLLEPAGEPGWRIRFTIDAAGPYTWRILATDRTGEVASAPVTGTASPRPTMAPIGLDPKHPRYFADSRGAPFFPVGQNLQNDWPVYRHSKLLADGGGNALRAWTFCHWTWLEWSFKPDVTWAKPGHFMHSYGGAGIYNQRIAWIADQHLASWERDGLRVMLCLGNGSELGDPEDWGAWGGHPYNQANGGWLASGGDFWTDGRARQAYRNRLRYTVARWGYSPTIWAWEFWNEIGRENDAIVDWHREMADYLHQLDPVHLVTTSHWGTNAEASPRLWNLDGLDFMQTHNYAGPDVIAARTKTMLKIADTPVINGEGGGPGGRDEDPTGLELLNSLWSAPMVGSAGTTLPWWWRERIEPRNLFSYYRPVGTFFEKLLATDGERVPLESGAVAVTSPQSQGMRPVLFVPIGPGWGQKSPLNRFVVQPDGTVPDLDQMAPVLYGTGKAQWCNPPTIEVDYPTGGQFQVHVGESSHGVLVIDLDGREVLRDARFDVDRQNFRESVSIQVPAGKHAITLGNEGSDWLRVSRILLTDYRDAAVTPDLVVHGLRVGDSYGLWLHDRMREWSYASLGLAPQPVDGATVTLAMPDGAYIALWMNTVDGQEWQSQAVAQGGKLQLAVPRSETDLAVRIGQ